MDYTTYIPGVGDVTCTPVGNTSWTTGVFVTVNCRRSKRLKVFPYVNSKFELAWVNGRNPLFGHFWIHRDDCMNVLMNQEYEITADDEYSVDVVEAILDACRNHYQSTTNGIVFVIGDLVRRELQLIADFRRRINRDIELFQEWLDKPNSTKRSPDDIKQQLTKLREKLRVGNQTIADREMKLRKINRTINEWAHIDEDTRPPLVPDVMKMLGGNKNLHLSEKFSVCDGTEHSVTA